MKHLLILLSIVALPFSQGGCGTTGTTASDFWNSPAVQAEIAFLEKIGTDALNAWIQSQLPNHPMARKLAAPSKEQAIANAVANAERECPHLPKAQVEASIRAKFSAAKK